MDLKIKQIFGDMFTEEHWKQVGLNMLTFLDTNVSAFVQKNLPVAGQYSEEQLRGLLFSKALRIPDTVQLVAGKDATEEEILAVSRINKARASAHALIVDAQATKNETAVQLEDQAMKFAAEVGTTLLTVLVSGATSGLMSGALSGK